MSKRHSIRWHRRPVKLYASDVVDVWFEGTSSPGGPRGVRRSDRTLLPHSVATCVLGARRPPCVLGKACVSTGVRPEMCVQSAC